MHINESSDSLVARRYDVFTTFKSFIVLPILSLLVKINNPHESLYGRCYLLFALAYRFLYTYQVDGWRPAPARDAV